MRGPALTGQLKNTLYNIMPKSLIFLFRSCLLRTHIATESYLFLVFRKTFYKTGHDIFIIPIDADFSFIRRYFKFMT